LALLSEKTFAAAARRCDVNEKTLRRWMADDEAFKRNLAEARHAMFQAGMHRVQALTAEAVCLRLFAPHRSASRSDGKSA
jgi:transposase-like protein